MFKERITQQMFPGVEAGKAVMEGGTFTSLGKEKFSFLFQDI